ncbi:MAG: DMT family transporter [Bacteroidales bacterium]|nr:DMT family transporter [Bacteroidales bacterium]
MANEQLKGHLALAGAYLIFGLNIVTCKDFTNSGLVPPMALFSLRAFGASLLFWLVSAFMPREKVEKSDAWRIAVASIVGLFIPQVTFLFALTMSTAIDTAIVGTMLPIFTMFFAAVAVKEPISFKKAFGVGVAFAGVVFLILNTFHAAGNVEHTTPLGMALLIINSISFGAYYGVFRPLISKYSVVTFMKWMFLVSLIVSLPFSFRELLQVNLLAIPGKLMGEMLFLIIFATFVAYFLIPFGQKRLRPTVSTMYSYLQPIIATIVAVITGLDIITWQKIVAIVLVIFGVFLVNRSRAAGQ